MKKLLLLTALTAALSFSAFAEGNQSTPAKGCLQGQTCLTGDQSTPAKTAPDGPGLIEIIRDYLSKLLG